LLNEHHPCPHDDVAIPLATRGESVVVEHFRFAALPGSRHALSQMLCLAVPVPDSDPRLAASRGVGIELIAILPR
jgi:hypothetical protein